MRHPCVQCIECSLLDSQLHGVGHQLRDIRADAVVGEAFGRSVHVLHIAADEGRGQRHLDSICCALRFARVAGRRLSTMGIVKNRRKKLGLLHLTGEASLEGNAGRCELCSRRRTVWGATSSWGFIHLCSICLAIVPFVAIEADQKPMRRKGRHDAMLRRALGSAFSGRQK